MCYVLDCFTTKVHFIHIKRSNIMLYNTISPQITTSKKFIQSQQLKMINKSICYMTDCCIGLHYCFLFTHFSFDKYRKICLQLFYICSNLLVFVCGLENAFLNIINYSNCHIHICLSHFELADHETPSTICHQYWDLFHSTVQRPTDIWDP